MTALILKDIATLKKTLLLSITLCIALVVYGVYENEIFMIPLICTVMPLILTAIAFGYDTNSKFEQFAFSMPIKRSSFVLSKLFFAFCFGLLGGITVFTLLSINGKVRFEIIVLSSIVTLISSIFMSAIQLPFMLKFGAEKSRLIMLITYFVVFVIFSMLKQASGLFTKVQRVLKNFSMTDVYSGLILVGLIIIAICLKISIRIMEKKEY